VAPSLEPPVDAIGRGGLNGISERVGCSSQGITEGIFLIVVLSRSRRGGVKAPPGLEGLFHLPWLAELEDASLLGHNGALMLGGKLGHQLGDKLADLLRVQVTVLLRNIDKRGEYLVMALLNTLLKDTSSSTDLHRQLLTASVTHKLAGLLLHVLGGAGGLIHGLAHFGALTVAHLLNRGVTLSHSLIKSLLLESDGTGFLKGLITDLLLRWGELGDVGVVALLRVLVGALQDRILLNTCDSLLLVYTAEAGFSILLTATEVNASRDGTPLLPSPAPLLVTM